MKFKIIEYNILDGFHTRDSPASLESERLKVARELIHAEKPDILVLPEACDNTITKHGVALDYSREFGLPYCFHGHKPNGSWHGITVLSRWPFKEKHNYSLKDMKFVRVVVEIVGKEIQINALHPHPSLSGAQTAQFFRNVLRDVTSPAIIIGDLNSVSRTDKPFNRDEIVAKFRTFEDLREEPLSFVENIIDDRLRFEAMDVIENAGYVDTYKKIHPKEKTFTIPTNFLDMDKKAASRIDYIFCSKELKVTDAGAIKSQLAEQGSDHYPVYAVLELK